MIVLDVFANVVVVLQPKLRKLRGIPCEVRRDAGAVVPKVRHEGRRVPRGYLAAQPRDDPWFDTPQQLCVSTVIAQGLRRERRCGIGSSRPSRSVVLALQCLGLERDEGKTL